MKSLRKTLLILFALFAFGQWTSAQTQYINQLMLIGDYEGTLIESNVQVYQEEGWTLVDYNLNSGTDSDQIIYLLYKTGLADDPDYAPITDFYIKSTSTKSDHPDMITYNNRNYYRITSIVGSASFMDSYGNLNDGAGGKYIYLYYTTDEWDYPRGISEITFDSTSDGAICGNGGTEPQDLNEDAHGDYIYMHYKYAMTIDVIDVYDHSDLSPLNATCSDTLYFRLADDVANNEVITSSNINVGNNNIAVIDLNGKYLGRLIQSGGGTDAGHVFKVIGNSTLIITDNSTKGTGYIATGDADKGGAFYIDASGKLIINGGTVESCHADYGGAIYNLGTLTINGGTIQNCYATRGWGQGIIYNNGTLTINGGTIQNNTAYYGGAIYNVYGWTTTINGGVIQNNNAIENNGYYTDDGVGGGILNYGILYINGGTIQGNSCDREGGGIWMTDEGGLFMKGNPVIKDNKLGSDANNVYVPNEHKIINVVGDFTEGACIGVTPQTYDNRITNNYCDGHNIGVDPAGIFFSDNGYFIKLDDDNEVSLDQSISALMVNYIDADGHDAFYSSCLPLTSITTSKNELTLNSGWYLLDATIRYNIPIYVVGNVNLILDDDHSLTANAGIGITSSASSLTIYGQSGQTGYLDATGANGDAGIGSSIGTININGGVVNATGGMAADAINLNWTDGRINPVASITATSYSGTVTLQKAFTDGTNNYYAGVVENNNTLANKTLYPFALFDINICTVENGSFIASPTPAHNGWTVTLEGTPDEGYPLCSEITVTGVNTGDNIAVTRIDNTNVFEFIMPDEAVNVNAKFEDKILVDYIDYYGETQTVPATVVIDNGEHDIYLNNGWYVVNNDIYSEMFCDVTGDDVNLILSDGKTLWLNEDFYFTQENNHLIVWGQSAGTGKISTVSIANPNWACRITINGGTVEAQAGNTGVAIGGPDAIVNINGGAVYASEYDGTIKFNRFYEDENGNKYAGEYTGSELDNLKNKWLNPCDNVFVKEGEWNVAGNWLNNSVPTINDYVSLRNGVTIPNGCLAEMKDVLVVDNSSVTIKDGGQLYVYHGTSPRANEMQVTVEKNISAANGEEQTNWYLLSPPVYNNHIDDSYPYYYAYIATVDNFTDGDYDMFRYKESEHKWQNKKAQGALGFFDMERGRGYLYRNAADVTISFTGTMTAGNQSSDNYHLSYTELDEEHAALQGFNLIGNPYTHNIYKSSAMPDDLETGFYKLADYGQWTACTDNSTIIGVGEAILVQAKSNANDRCLIFEDRLATSAKAKSNNDNIMFTVANSQYSDVTYALFEEGHGLTKIGHRNAEVPMIYIPKNDENLAIATMSNDTKLFPLNFKAMTMGSYTISCKSEGDFSYLHLIDRFTGEDVDMLLDGEYTFMASPTDNPERFIVKLEYSDGSDISEVFAYQNGEEIIVSGEGTLQVFDVLGRMVATQYINGVQTMCTSSLQTGVYIFKLNDKTQKIVVR